LLATIGWGNGYRAIWLLVPLISCFKFSTAILLPPPRFSRKWGLYSNYSNRTQQAIVVRLPTTTPTLTL